MKIRTYADIRLDNVIFGMNQAELDRIKEFIKQREIEINMPISELTPREMRLYDGGNKVMAIKSYRDRTKLSVKESKEMVETLFARAVGSLNALGVKNG